MERSGSSGRPGRNFKALFCYLVLSSLLRSVLSAPGLIDTRSFTIAEDKFWKDGQPFQIISGSLHYYRVPPEYWRDRLLRLKALGLNSVQVYIPWNFHEYTPGEFMFDGWRNITQFVELVNDVGLLLLLRPGPYICAEWEFGGLPAWLLSGDKLEHPVGKLRSSDEGYLWYVDRWWNKLFPLFVPYLYQNGGPIIALQIENEYGFYNNIDPPYLRHLHQLARQHFGPDLIVYTTDNGAGDKAVVERGTLTDEGVFTVVDFAPGTNVTQAFETQKLFNEPGKSPALCSEYYTGWLTHWGEPMANTSTAKMISTLEDILRYANGTGSVNLYMAFGGTNFGFWAGANFYLGQNRGVITSYDYDCQIGEAGTYGQLGIGGAGKFEATRGLFTTLGIAVPPTVPPQPRLAAYGATTLTSTAPFLLSLDCLSHGSPAVQTLWPMPFEPLGLSLGMVLYTATLAPGTLSNVTILQAVVHDHATVYVNGVVVGQLSMPRPRIFLPVVQSDAVRLDILVDAEGRDNFFQPGVMGETTHKGIVSNVTLTFANPMAAEGAIQAGTPVAGWHSTLLPLDDVSCLPWLPVPSQAPPQEADADQGLRGPRFSTEASTRAKLQTWSRGRQTLLEPQPRQVGTVPSLQTEAGEPVLALGSASADRHQSGSLDLQPQDQQPAVLGGVQPSPWADTQGLTGGAGPSTGAGAGGPTWYRAQFQSPAAPGQAFPDDTFLSTDGWCRGVAWINGHNLGRYWPVLGPQRALYVPGVWLQPNGTNEVVLLELGCGGLRLPPPTSVDLPDFGGAVPAPAPVGEGRWVAKAKRGVEDLEVN